MSLRDAKKALPCALLAAIVAGCSVIRVRDEDHKVYTTLYAPAWPWQDINKTLSRLSVTHRTNGLTVTMKDLDESATTSTNFSKLLSVVAEATAAGVVKGLKP